MKTTKHLLRPLGLGSLVAATLTLVVSGCASTGSKSAVRVTDEDKYIQLRHAQDTSQPLNLKKGDAVAMACSKCKTIWYASVNGPTSGFPYPWGGSLAHRWPYHSPLANPVLDNREPRHYCPGCKSTITVTGTGKHRKEPVTHTCGACGDDSVFCCATTVDRSPTEGMPPRRDAPPRQ